MRSLGARRSDLVQGERWARMQASPMWTGDRFQNQHPKLPGLRDPGAKMPSLTDFLCGDNRRVPSGPLPVADPRAVWLKPPSTGLRATWLGHSSVLLELDGHRVLTDPVWGQRASPTQLAGPKRFQAPAVALRDLPPLDAVVVSHDHYDHLCWPTIRKLARDSPVPFVTSLGVGAHLQAFGVPPERITELDWWQRHRVPGTGIEITAAPSQHFSGCGLKDRNATLWSSMVVASHNHRVFFSGDTGLTTEYRQIRERLGPFDLVLLEVGAFHPAWGDVHLGPDNALKALDLLGGGAFLPVHWGSFCLAMHPWDQPAERLLELAPGLGTHLLMPKLGEALEPGQVDSVTPWWRTVDCERQRDAAARSAGAGAGAPDEVAPPAPDTDPLSWPKALPWPLD